MRRYAATQKTSAYKELAVALGQVRYILALEAKLPDPPTGRFTARANALRAGALILLVSLFEYYLRSAFTEIADRINAISMREGWKPAQDLLDRNGAAFADYLRNFKGAKPDRLGLVRQAAAMISSDALYSQAFGDTRASPKPETVKDMFEAVGTTQVWPTLAANYNALGTPDPENVIVQRLRFLCETRNEIVHAGAGVRMSRGELHVYLAYVERLAEAIDMQLRQEFRRYSRR